MAAMVLGLIIDTAVFDILEIARSDQFAVDEGPFASILGHVEGMSQLIVPVLIVGTLIWIIWGAVREERQEERVTRVRRRK